MPILKDHLHGTLDALVLKTLTFGPRHGYGIVRWLREQTQNGVAIEEGSIYPALYRMERDEWIEADWGVSELGRMSQLLTYIQLSKSGTLPISWWTMAKTARVPNYGPPPKDTNTEMERVMAQRHIEAEMQVELAKELQAAQGDTTPPPPPGGGQEGRPPTNQKPPQIQNKPNEGRSTITTS